jgi:hypothetical protein
MSSFEPVSGIPLGLLTSPVNIFPPSVKAAFVTTIQAKGYINRERFSYAKYVRLQVFLDNPSLKAVNQADRKIKYEALYDYELYNNGSRRKLYRLLDKSHTERRLVVFTNDAFDMLTSIHLKLGHPSRDKCFYGVD